MWAMLPRRVGGPEWSRTDRFLFSRLLAEPQDQLLKLSMVLMPLEKGGTGGLLGRECEDSGCCCC